MKAFPMMNLTDPSTNGDQEAILSATGSGTSSHRMLLLAAAAALTFSASGLAAAATVGAGLASVHPVGQVHQFAATKGLKVLYSQTKTDSGIGIVSQNFESSFDQYDAQAADDFTVPSTATTWTISEVDVAGVYFNGTGLATSENVTFYADNAGLPGKTVKAFTNVAGVDNGTGSFSMTLPTAVKLKPGKYWVSVQANLAFSAGGEWAWENITTVVGSPAAWKNPGGGFGVGCTKYTTETTCIADGQGDHIFVLKGKAK
jgi:hypothetical protein